jgi:hypothetical protein
MKNVSLRTGFMMILMIHLVQLAYTQPFHPNVLKTNHYSEPGSLAPGYSPEENKYDVNFYFLDLEVTNSSTFIKGNTLIKASRIAASIDTFVVELNEALIVDSVFVNDKIASGFYHSEDLLKVVLSGEDKTVS